MIYYAEIIEPKQNIASHLHCFTVTRRKLEMIDDEVLGFLANFLGIFIFALVIAYHLVVADPKYEAS
ncbi:hypothetical protein HN51_030606 [Arachis hypogaea]